MKNVKLTDLRTCGGCQAKIDSVTLSDVLSQIPVVMNENLLVGYSHSDDAGIYKINDTTALVQTMDFFPPPVDDPYLFGQIAAANALSDVYAMGGTPITAMNIVCFPDALDSDILVKILQGGASKVQEAGAVICGGHSIKDKEPKYGLSITGLINPEQIFVNDQLQIGDKLILTKPLGPALITQAYIQNSCDEELFKQATDIMIQLNKQGAEILKKHKIKCCTDITGFGLMGHLKEMLTASKLSASINFNKVPFLPKVLELMKSTQFASSQKRANINRGSLESYQFSNECTEDHSLWLSDPQTSGGLLIAVAPEKVDQVYKELVEYYPMSSIIGEITSSTDKLIQLH